jgi:hypothetical protein
MAPEDVLQHPSFWICIYILVEVLVVRLTLPEELQKFVKIILSFHPSFLRLPANIKKNNRTLFFRPIFSGMLQFGYGGEKTTAPTCS